VNHPIGYLHTTVKVVLILCLSILVFSACREEQTKLATEQPVLQQSVTLDLTVEEREYLGGLREKGGLQAGTMPYPGSYEIHADGEISGIHHVLLIEFGKQFDIPVHVHLVDFEDFFSQNGSIPEGVKTDESIIYTPDIFNTVDVISFDLTETAWRNRLMDFIPIYPYRIVLANRRGEEVIHIGELQKKRIVVFENTVHEEFLTSLSEKLGLNIEMISKPFGEDRFQMILGGTVDYTMGESQGLVHFINRYPDLNISYSLSDIHMNGWAVAKGNDILREILFKYIAYAKKAGIMDDAFLNGLGVSFDKYITLINYNAPDRPDFSAEELEYLTELRETGGFKVAIFNGGWVYNERDDGTGGGLHYFWALEIAHMLDMQIRFTPVQFRQFFEKNGEMPEAIKTDDSFSYKPDLLRDHQFYVGNLSPLPWREKFLSFINLIPTRLVYIVRKDTEPIPRKDLDLYRFAFIPNSSYEVWLKENTNFKNLNLIEAGSVEDVLKLVMSDEADVTVADANLILARLRAYPDITFYPADDYVDILSWAVSKENEILKSILEKSIGHIKQNGVFSSVWESYYGSSFNSYLELLSASSVQ
jgi:membrane-bound lytic murein transglycosylase MltF